MSSLPETTSRHDAALRVHVDRLPAIADLLADGPSDDLRAGLDAEHAFLAGQLLPHVGAVEASLYPELERILACCHSMAGMRREHEEIARLVGTIGTYRDTLAGGGLDTAEQTGLRRALYRLHALLKVHLAEEHLFVGVLQKNLSPEEADVLARAMDHALAEPL
jgi:hypothetical protein